MSTRAKVAAAIASAGVLGAGWAIGTANGATSSGSAATGTTASGTATSAAPTSAGATPTAGTSTAKATTGTSTASAAASSAKSSATTSGNGSYSDGTYAGTTVTHQYGSVSVTVTISGGKITDVSSQVVSDGDRKSDQINSRAVPQVKAAVLAANSANVSTISGATYTTKAYLSSLQSALAKA